MGNPAARITDMHSCPEATGPVPHVGGPILPPGCPTVLIGDLPAARVGDLATCTGPPDTIVLGAFTVLIGGQPAARLGDPTAHGGVIVVGCPTVLIGMEVGGGAASPGLAAPGAAAQMAANAAQSGGRTAGAAAELRIGDRVYVDVSTAGVSRANSPAVQQALEKLTREQRSYYHGACAEIGCLNQATNAGVNPAGGIMRSVRIRRTGHPDHATPIPPCDSCKNVMDLMGVKYE